MTDRMPNEQPAYRDAGSRREVDQEVQTGHVLSDLINEGAALLRAGKAEAALPVLERAYALDPENVSAAINLGGAYVLTGKHRLAVPILQKACENEPGNPMVWINLGAAYLDRPPFDTPEGEERAIGAFEQALALDPAAHSVCYNLGLIHKERGELNQAIERFDQALSIDPSDRDARYWRDRLQKVAGASSSCEGTVDPSSDNGTGDGI